MLVFSLFTGETMDYQNIDMNYVFSLTSAVSQTLKCLFGCFYTVLIDKEANNFS